MKNNKFNCKKVSANTVGLTIDGKVAVALTGNNARYSRYRNDDNCSDDVTYRAYDEKTSSLVDATNFIICDLSSMSWWMPTTKIKAGDIIKKDNKYYYIISAENGRVKVINYSDSKEDNLVSELNIFLNKEIFKKLVTPFNKGLEMDNQAVKIMMLSSMTGGDNTNNNGINPMLMMMMSEKGGLKDLFNFDKSNSDEEK